MNATQTNPIKAIYDEASQARFQAVKEIYQVAAAKAQLVRTERNQENRRGYIDLNVDDQPFSWLKVKFLPRPNDEILSKITMKHVSEAFFHNPDLSPRIREELTKLSGDGLPRAVDGALMFTAREVKGEPLTMDEKYALRSEFLAYVINQGSELAPS